MLEKRFEFESRESAIYDLWEKSGCFAPNLVSDKPVFSIAMPPPNANGELHLGHAFGYTIMDILGRFHRHLGEPTLLLPGKDHAGIQTQVVFEKKLKADKVDYRNLPTTSLYEQCYSFCVDRAKYMRSQEKTLGISADWSKELFTLDPRLNEIIFETFEQMWRDGLVYRGNRIVNWSVFSQTSISDVEVEYKEQDGNLWYVVYPMASQDNSISGEEISLPSGNKIKLGSPGIVIATTRPETMLGDTALAVHPEDTRYSPFIGKKVIVPLIGREIPIIADLRIDPSFGTGVVKITPAHDFLDNDIGNDHKLDLIQVIGKDGLMTREAGERFAGLKISECRDAVLSSLESEGLLLEVVPHKHKVPIGERGKDIIEPLPSLQWWVNVDKPGMSLKQKALKFIKEGKVAIHPERFTVMFEQWLENLRDWNISRQLWWGHQLPVWYRTVDGKEEIHVGRQSPTGEGWIQESDVFDTWFSSGQWAYSTMAAHGYADLNNPSDSRFIPNHTMVMGRDILFFWACRMLLLTAYRLDTIPWKNIFFTGLIRDEHGQKMSKSKGNGIEPGEMISKYGADSLRLALVMGATPGNDISFSPRKVEGYSKFINKIWNAAKLVELKFGEKSYSNSIPTLKLDTSRWIISLLQGLKSHVRSKMLSYDLSISVDEIYIFVWNTYCDWYLEMMKVLVDKGGAEYAEELVAVNREVLRTILMLLHPFIPYVTEEIYQKLPLIKNEPLLAGFEWENVVKVEQFGDLKGIDNSRIDLLITLVSAVRSVKATLQIPHQRINVSTSVPLEGELLLLFKELARVEIVDRSSIPEDKALTKPIGGDVVICEVEEKSRYRERLESDAAGHKQTIATLEAKLSGSFAQMAKPDIVEKERERLAQAKLALVAIERELAV